MKETFDTDIIPTTPLSAHTLSKPIFLALGKSYTYDGHNRRVKVAGNGDTRYYLYSQSGQLLLSEDNGVQTNYIYLGSKLIAEDRQATTTFIHTDMLGSPVARTNSTGRVESRRHYQPFGDTYEAPNDDIGYTGHKYDNDLGLSYMQARYYDPVIGRFYSNDPVGFRDVLSFNRYAYANNNPYKYVDPDGQDAMITHMKNGSIQIDIPTKFTGPLATKQNIQAIKTQVSKKWSGTYKVNGKNTNVTVNVTDAKSGIGPKNEVTLLDKDPASGRSYVQGNKGEWNASGDNMTSGMVEHEAGHLMGADDQYYEGTGMALPGHENDIMGNLQGTPQDSTMKEILDSDRNWTKKE